MRRVTIAVVLAAAMLAVPIAHGIPGSPTPQARWQALLEAPSAIDIAGPRTDGRYVLAAGGRLSLLRVGDHPTPFARGPHGYSTSPDVEAYIALSSRRRMPRAGCAFHRDDVYALAPGADAGVIRISRDGIARRFADLPGSNGRGGIAFDSGGRFGGRLLVMAQSATGDGTNLYGFDCAGGRKTFVSGGPRVEGGMVIAPPSFGRFGGAMIAADEATSSIYAFGPRGGWRLVARPRLVSSGLDQGLETLGFVPSFRNFDLSLVSVRVPPGSPSTGGDRLLAAPAGALWRAGARKGDLLATTEDGVLTVRVRCQRRCGSRRVAEGPPGTEAEGHVEFGARSPLPDGAASRR